MCLAFGKDQQYSSSELVSSNIVSTLTLGSRPHGSSFEVLRTLRRPLMEKSSSCDLSHTPLATVPPTHELTISLTQQFTGATVREGDIIIYTDNSNVFFTVRKGRSGVYRLNALCRHVLLCEIVFNVRIHVRWCGTDSMPADKYTRDENSVDPFKGPKSERPNKFRGHPTPKRGPARPPTTDRGSRTVLA